MGYEREVRLEYFKAIGGRLGCLIRFHRVPGEGIENLHWFFGIVGCLLAFALAGGYGTLRAFSK